MLSTFSSRERLIVKLYITGRSGAALVYNSGFFNQYAAACNTVLVECRALWGSPNQAAIYRSQKYTPEEAGGGAWV